MAMEIPYGLRDEVKFALVESAGLGPIGAFSSAADIGGIATVWGYLLYRFSKHYHYSMDKDSATKLVTSVLLGMGGYYAGCKAATKLFHLIPYAGSLVAMGISSLQNVIFTYRFAVTLTRIFGGQTLGVGTREEAFTTMNTLKDSIITMFAGTGGSLLSIKDIVDLYLMEDPPSNGSRQALPKGQADTGKQGLLMSETVTFDNGREVRIKLYSKKLMIGDNTVEMYSISTVKRNRKQLTIFTSSGNYRLQFPDAEHSAKWEQVIRAKII